MKKLLLLFAVLWFLFSCQNTKDIAGQYENGIIINPNNTFELFGYGTIVKGNVEIKDSLIVLIPYKPTQPFVLYARKKGSIVGGNKNYVPRG